MAELRWLDLDTTARAGRAARIVGVSRVAAGPGGFLAAYQRAGGDPAALGAHRASGASWRDRRNGFVARHRAQAKQNREGWWHNGRPTRRHLALAVWAWSPTPARLRAWLLQNQGGQ